MVSQFNTLRDGSLELEKELLRIGRENCNSLTDKSQLSVVIQLLLRASSLFQSMINLLGRCDLDAYDCVRRGYLETWLLAFELRLSDSETKAAQWQRGQPATWSAHIGKLEAYAKSRGKESPSLGKNYGDLSEVAHPTVTAAENSVAMTTVRHGVSTESSSIVSATEKFEKELPELFYRLIWVALDEDSAFIKLSVEETNLPICTQFADAHLPSK